MANQHRHLVDGPDLSMVGDARHARRRARRRRQLGRVGRARWVSSHGLSPSGVGPISRPKRSLRSRVDAQPQIAGHVRAMTTSWDHVSYAWTGGGTGRWSLLVHGGAGSVSEGKIPSKIAGCRRATAVAAKILREGGKSIDAVQRAVEELEDDPLFNAGTGGALDERGELRLDASIMNGATLAAGSVCDLPPFRNPIAIARAVLEDGRHVMYASDGADAFARAHGFVRADPQEMITDEARELLKSALETKIERAPVMGGTVGAVAIDRDGHVAAATSTGGRTAKRWGRVGDSPVIGAGTYADDLLGATSGTGEGEGFVRMSASIRTCQWLANASALHAVSQTIHDLKTRVGAVGALITVDRHGRLALARSTQMVSWAAAWDGSGDPIGGS
ncbi:MAG: isoaspartyl peptidase/L-asparaginase [Polyangiaceae bacterium]